MPNLAFRDVTFNVQSINNQIYISSAQLASALGYANENAVTKIYNRNSDEFTDEMTRLPNLGSTANLKAERRVFSLRGAHLVAMFSRTPIAKEFRKWVLDVLDKEVGNTDLATAAHALRHKRFYLSFEYDGKISLHQMPDNPYDGFAKAIADPGNIGLEDSTIEEIGQACITALAHRAKRRKENITSLKRTK